ncbi:MAG: hypothetical protein ABW157_11550 [Candidatus Thiodiazotropha sp. LLP2]
MDTNVEYYRKYRTTLYGIVDYILSNEKSVTEFGISLEWKDLEEIPTWLLWERNAIKQLVMTAGTIFLLPSIKIWIDSKKIREVSDLVGEEVFKFILANTHVNNQKVSSLNITKVSDNLLTAGISVIYSCYSIRLRPWLTHTLPKSNAKGKLDPILANEILKHSLFVLENTTKDLSISNDLE